MDDLFDLLFTVFAAFFVLLFIGVLVSDAVYEKDKGIEDLLERSSKVDDYLVANKGIINEGKSINPEKVNNDIKALWKGKGVEIPK